MRIREPENDAERQAFLDKLPSSLRPLTEACDGRAVLLGAWARDSLIGRLAAMAASNDPETYKLLFLLATEPEAGHCLEGGSDRHPGPLQVERALLAEFEARVRGLEYRKLAMQPVFLVGTHQASLLLEALRQEQWQEIRHVSTRFHIEGYGIRQERWFQTPLPQGYEFFFWRDLAPEDREYVESRESDAGPLYPLRLERFEPQTSVGLRDISTGRVAGWFVTERVDALTVRFSKLFLLPEARSHACFYPLIAQTVEYAWQHFKRGVMAVNADNPRMRAVLTKMLGRHCSMIVDCYYCEKVLNVPGHRTGC